MFFSFQFFKTEEIIVDLERVNFSDPTKYDVIPIYPNQSESSSLEKYSIVCFEWKLKEAKLDVWSSIGFDKCKPFSVIFTPCLKSKEKAVDDGHLNPCVYEAAPPAAGSAPAPTEISIRAVMKTKDSQSTASAIKSAVTIIDVTAEGVNIKDSAGILKYAKTVSLMMVSRNDFSKNDTKAEKGVSRSSSSESFSENQDDDQESVASFNTAVRSVYGNNKNFKPKLLVQNSEVSVRVHAFMHKKDPGPQVRSGNVSLSKIHITF